jgi:hypothetical protein
VDDKPETNLEIMNANAQYADSNEVRQRLQSRHPASV